MKAACQSPRLYKERILFFENDHEMLKICAAAHMDDVTMTWNEHIQAINGISTMVFASRIKLRLRKCKFAQQLIKILGHIIRNEMNRPDPEKDQSVMALKVPTTKRK